TQSRILRELLMNLAIAAAVVAASVTFVASSMAQGDTGHASQAVARLFADERAEAYRSDPLLATYEGVHDYDDRLPSATPAEFERRLNVDQEFLARLHAIDRKTLTPQEQVSYDLFDVLVDERVKLARYREWRLPFNSDSGFYSDLLLLHETQLPHTTRDYEN